MLSPLQTTTEPAKKQLSFIHSTTFLHNCSNVFQQFHIRRTILTVFFFTKNLIVFTMVEAFRVVYITKLSWAPLIDIEV